MRGFTLQPSSFPSTGVCKPIIPIFLLLTNWGRIFETSISSPISSGTLYRKPIFYRLLLVLLQDTSETKVSSCLGGILCLLSSYSRVWRAFPCKCFVALGLAAFSCKEREKNVLQPTPVTSYHPPYLSIQHFNSSMAALNILHRPLLKLLHSRGGHSPALVGPLTRSHHHLLAPGVLLPLRPRIRPGTLYSSLL